MPMKGGQENVPSKQQRVADYSKYLELFLRCCFKNEWEKIYFCWSFQCFQSDISQANIASVDVCGNFVHWGGSFVIDSIISDVGSLLFMPVKCGFVMTGTE